MITALEELKKTGTIFSYEILEIKEGRKIVDVKYTVTPTHEFSREQKAANARKNMIEEKAVKKGLKITDQSKHK